MLRSVVLRLRTPSSVCCLKQQSRGETSARHDDIIIESPILCTVTRAGDYSNGLPGEY